MSSNFKDKKYLWDKSIYVFTFSAASLVLLILLGILIVLMIESKLSFDNFGFFRFIFSLEWDPVKVDFGAGTAIFGTLISTLISLLMAIPIAVGTAIFVTEIAPEKLKKPIGMAIELLAAIPSIIYGMWGLFTLTPIMANYVEPILQKSFGWIPVIGTIFQGKPMGIDLLTSSLILSIMVVPFTASISRDAMNLTPSIVKESSYGLGATKWEVIWGIILPYSLPGIVGGAILSLGRALGETMAVAFVLGNKHQIPKSLFDPANTITVTLANEFTEATGDVYLSSLFYLALILFIMSFGILALSKYILARAERRFKR